MIVYGLIGYPLGHSGSAAIFREIFKSGNLYDRDYRLYPIKDPQMVRSLAEAHPGLNGLNVTIPYKETIIPFLDELDPVAASIGAVNTIQIIRKKKGVFLKGFNTDAEGFSGSADFSGFSSALLLGTGGAAKAVAFALHEKGIKVLSVSRTLRKPGIISYKDLDPSILNQYHLIINATPCGMFPDDGSCPPLRFETLTPDHFLYDLVYNPEFTLFLEKGKEMGCRVQNGMNMLKKQAELSYLIWRGLN